jgi:hypothetical protein
MFPAFTETRRVAITLYTDALATHGWVRTHQHRVSDIVNLADHPFLILEDVTVEELGEPTQPIRANVAQVNLDSVLFAIADSPSDSLPELRTPKRPEQAILSVPPFKIVGTIHLQPGEMSMGEALTELSDRFIPVTDATYWSDRLGEARQKAVMLAVNQRRAQIVAEHHEVDPWAGLGGPAPVRPVSDPDLR